MIIRKSDGWLTAMVGNELVMMSVEQGSYIALNEVGSRIWTLIDAPQSLDEICGTLEREFEVEPAVCRVEAEAFVNTLVEYGAALLDPEAAI